LIILLLAVVVPADLAVAAAGAAQAVYWPDLA
jgi:hypothetical protein